MELLEYLIQLRGGAVTSAELKGVRDQFMEVGAAAREAGAASAEGTAAAAGKGKGAGGFGAAVGKMAKVGAIGLVALGVTAVKMSNSFQTEMLKIRTEGGATSKEFRTMRQGVLNLAASGKSLGAGPTSLAQGLYYLESMGIRGKKALLGLKLAAQESAISGASLEDTTRSLGGALFISAKGTGNLHQVMGTLNGIVGSGAMRFQQLNEALGTGLLGSAKVAQVSLREIGATLAVLTDSGYPASSAAAQLGTALHYLYAPTTKAQNALATIGLTGHKLAADLSKPQGILAVLRDLRTHMEGLGKFQQQDVLNALLPGGRGKVLLNLYQLQNRLGPKYAGIPTGNAGARMMDMHAAEQALNPATKMHVAVAKLQVEMVRLGDVLTKYLTPAFTFLAHVLGMILGWLLAAFNWFTKMGPVAKGLAVFVGVLAGAFLLYNAAVTIAAVATGLFELAVMLLTSPITLVVIAIALLAAGVVYAYNKFGWFRKGVAAVWSWLKTAASDTAHWVVNAFGNVVTFFSKLPGRIGRFFSGAFNGVKGVVVDILNFILARINNVIDVLNSMHISTPFGDIGIPHINHVGLIGTGSKPAAPTRHQAAAIRSGASKLGAGKAAQLTHSFAHTQLSHAQDRPALVHGDIVLKVRHQELARITRRQLHEAMAG